MYKLPTLVIKSVVLAINSSNFTGFQSGIDVEHSLRDKKLIFVNNIIDILTSEITI